MVLDNKFVIVIPTYNAESLIEKCLMSILSQNFDDLGVIIRDDISTDRTSEVVKNLLVRRGMSGAMCSWLIIVVTIKSIVLMIGL